MNLQKQQLLLRLFRYFKGKKGEPHFFNKRNIWLLAIATAYILTPDEFLFDGIGKLGLLDDAAVILGAIFTVFFPGIRRRSAIPAMNGASGRKLSGTSGTAP